MSSTSTKSTSRRRKPASPFAPRFEAENIASSSSKPAVHVATEAVAEIPVAKRKVRFGLFQPDAREVFLVGSFNAWKPGVTPLTRDWLGDWSAELMLPPGEHRYRFIVDGEWRDDPNALQTIQNPFGGFDSIVTVV